VDVVSNRETVAGLRTALSLIENTLEVILGDLDVRELVVVVGVEVEVRDNVAEVLQHGLTSVVARRVGGTHVSWVLSDNVTDGHFVLDHLVVALGVTDNAQVLVGPCVASNLVAFSYHALDDIGPLRGGVDGTLADVDTGHEKGSLEAILGELVKHAVGVDVRAVIISNGDSTRRLAGVDTTATILDIAFLRTRVVTSASTGWCLVGVAAWAEIDETVRGIAVVLGSTAVSLQETSAGVMLWDLNVTYCARATEACRA
jgi:hypothetical protein